MILAKGKKGQIGRKIPGVGFDARVAHTPMGEHRGQLYISARSIAADENHYAAKEDEARRINEARKFKRIAIQKAESLQAKKDHQRAVRSQALAGYDPMNEKLRRHFAKSGAMGETEQTIESLVANPPADFSQSGANPQYVNSSTPKPVVVYAADFRNTLPVGSPLTRDGSFGPAVTDYERIVSGYDVNQDNVVEIAGGTMLGRYNGSTAPGGTGVNHLKHRTRDGMGDWWDSITDFTSGVGDKLTTQAQTTAANAANEALKKELAKLTGTTVKPPTTSGGTIVYQNPVQGAVNTISQNMGVPQWAIYTGVGLIGVGVLFMIVKAVK